MVSYDAGRGAQAPPAIGPSGGAIAARGRGMPAGRFTTEHEPPRHQFDAYRSQIAPVVDLQRDDSATEGFDACFEMWRLGPMTLRRIRTPAGRFLRHAAQARRDGLDHWVINVLNAGEEAIASGERGFRGTPGVLNIFSLAAPSEVRRSAVDWTGLFVPRGLVPRLDASVHHLARVALDGAQGRLLARHIIALAEEMPSMSEADLATCSETTLAMIGTIAVPGAARPGEEAGMPDGPRLHHVRRIIDENLSSWSLGTRRLAKLSGMSRTTLYRLFEPYGGVMRYIQRERLLRAHRIITGPRHRRIQEVAEELCFSDASSFARAFRREFGYTASELQQGRLGAAQPAGPRAAGPVADRNAWAMLYG